MEKCGFIYIWFDKKHKRYYVGCHWGLEDDGYICSSTWMKQGYKHRPQDFKRRILKRNIPKTKLHEEEYKWLKLIKDDELGKRYYNLNNHHFGHWSTDENTHLSVREKVSLKTKEAMNTPEMREKMQPVWEANRNRVHSEDEKRRRAKSNTGKKRSEETKRKISESQRGKIVGPLSEETKRKLSQALSGERNPFYGKTHSKETMERISKKISATLKGRKPKNLDMFKGSSWWNNGSINKRCKDCPGEGWTKGRF